MSTRKNKRRRVETDVQIHHEDFVETLQKEEAPQPEEYLKVADVAQEVPPPAEGADAETSAKEREVWDAFREEHYELLEQLPLSLHRAFTLIHELDQQAQDNITHITPAILKYVSLRKALAAAAERKDDAPQDSEGQAAGDGDVPTPSTDVNQQPTERPLTNGKTVNGTSSSSNKPAPANPSKRSRQSPSTAHSLAATVQNSNSTRELLINIAQSAEEVSRASAEKVYLAQHAYDLVDRYIRDLDRAIKEQEASISLGLRPGTHPASIILPEVVVPQSNRGRVLATPPSTSVAVPASASTSVHLPVPATATAPPAPPNTAPAPPPPAAPPTLVPPPPPLAVPSALTSPAAAPASAPPPELTPVAPPAPPSTAVPGPVPEPEEQTEHSDDIIVNVVDEPAPQGPSANELLPPPSPQKASEAQAEAPGAPEAPNVPEASQTEGPQPDAQQAAAPKGKKKGKKRKKTTSRRQTKPPATDPEAGAGSATGEVEAAAAAPPPEESQPPLTLRIPAQSLVPVPVDDMPPDPNEPRYCFCNQVSFGDMIACDNPTCAREWFHIGCVGLTKIPKGKWYCRECVALRKRPKSRRRR
ncbi:hypothetical protein BD413DRAFT_608411 [Trametes elegans]|nr:hypothetical protein BD413DRAFT_608411 [Trametes elegans]